MYRYAQITENNICIADSWLSEKVEGKDMIQLSHDAPSPLGKKYKEGIWEEMESMEQDLQQKEEWEAVKP